MGGLYRWKYRELAILIRVYADAEIDFVRPLIGFEILEQ